MRRPVQVAIIGGSGSGKTWLARKMTERLAPWAARISLDDFYHDLSSRPAAHRNQVNFDDPAAIDWTEVHARMEQLEIGASVRLPQYDFTSHTRRSERALFVTPPVVIWDGLWLLHPARLRAQFAFSVFVSCGLEERLRRRSERDVRERGRSLESVQCQFLEHVQPMHERFVEPQRHQARQILPSPVKTEQLDKLVQLLLSLKCLNG